ncbi:MAG: hypothetical protein JRI68_05275 [Deltaproteobacteria bacterium]|nr:hypothetical protein [Deltaproteobacteria bacterium]
MKLVQPWWLLGASALAVVACDDPPQDEDDDDSVAKTTAATGSGAQGEAKRKTAKPTKPGPHGGADLAGIRAKLQGTWLVGSAAFPASRTIWHVEGDQLTIIRGDKEQQTTMKLVAPCHLITTVERPGGSSSTFHNFVFDGDKLYSGLGNAGIKLGDTTVACFSAGIYVLDGDQCVRWSSKFGPDNFQPSEAKCGLSAADPKVFEATDTSSAEPTYGTEKMDVHGKVLLTAQMRGNLTEKVATLAEAKGRLAEAKKNKQK